MVELADSGNEGLVYGLLTTTYHPAVHTSLPSSRPPHALLPPSSRARYNLGSPFGRALANQIYGSFEPSLDDPANYLADTPEFRATVARSFGLSYSFALLAQLTLVLLPPQKEETQRR
jgi:hypothetical protein